MPIFVDVNTIDYGLVLDYYNTHKKESEPKLERLDRLEGGFQIQIPEKDRCNSNQKIRQLRWNRKWLIPKQGYPYFEDEQELLLVEALKYVLGDEIVLYNK